MLGKPKPREVLVEYLGDDLLHRWSVDRRTLYAFKRGQPVRIKGGGPFMCAKCNRLYEGKSPPEKCEQHILITLRLVRPDGSPASYTRAPPGVGQHSLITKRAQEWSICSSTEFEGDLDIKEYEHLSRTNPETWSLKER